MTKLTLRRITLTILCFFLDIVSSGIYARQILLPSLANFCVLSWLMRSAMLSLFSGLLCLWVGIINGSSFLSEAFFLCFVFLTVFILKRLLAQSGYLVCATTFFFCGLYSYMIGDMGFWTSFGIIANILIITSMVYFQEVG